MQHPTSLSVPCPSWPYCGRPADLIPINIQTNTQKDKHIRQPPTKLSLSTVLTGCRHKINSENSSINPRTSNHSKKHFQYIKPHSRILGKATKIILKWTIKIAITQAHSALHSRLVTNLHNTRATDRCKPHGKVSTTANMCCICHQTLDGRLFEFWNIAKKKRKKETQPSEEIPCSMSTQKYKSIHNSKPSRHYRWELVW